MCRPHQRAVQNLDTTAFKPASERTNLLHLHNSKKHLSTQLRYVYIQHHLRLPPQTSPCVGAWATSITAWGAKVSSSSSHERRPGFPATPIPFAIHPVRTSRWNTSFTKTSFVKLAILLARFFPNLLNQSVQNRGGNGEKRKTRSRYQATTVTRTHQSLSIGMRRS